ncbi:effector-associated constant component EACC1 [Streptomyces sp. S6]
MEQRTDTLRLEIRAASDDADHTTLDLYRWLEQDPDVRDHAVLSRRSLDLDTELDGDFDGECDGDFDLGTMGSVEIINLVLSQGVALANLALSYATWRTARPTATGITITANGRTVTLSGECDAETVRRILESLDADGPR